MYDVSPANWPLMLDAGIVLECVSPMISLQVFCILTEQGGVWYSTTHTIKRAVHSTEGCCTATTVAFTSIAQKLWLALYLL